MTRTEAHLDAMLRHLGAASCESLHGRAARSEWPARWTRWRNTSASRAPAYPAGKSRAFTGTGCWSSRRTRDVAAGRGPADQDLRRGDRRPGLDLPVRGAPLYVLRQLLRLRQL